MKICVSFLSLKESYLRFKREKDTTLFKIGVAFELKKNPKKTEEEIFISMIFKMSVIIEKNRKNHILIKI